MTLALDRIKHVLNAYGVTEAEVQERVELYRRGYFHRVRLDANHFPVLDVAALLELLQERHARQMEVAALPTLEAAVATVLPRREPAVVVPRAPARPATLDAAEIARFCFGSRGVRWMLRNLPANFPPRDKKTGSWARFEVEAWMSENLTNGKRAIAAMKKAKRTVKP